MRQSCQPFRFSGYIISLKHERFYLMCINININIDTVWTLVMMALVKQLPNVCLRPVITPDLLSLILFVHVILKHGFISSPRGMLTLKKMKTLL